MTSKPHEDLAPPVDPETSSLSGSINFSQPTRKRLFWIFIVNNNISYFNFCSYLVACFGTICLVAYLAIIQPFVLSVILGISESKGNLTGNLALYDELIALPSTLIWGILSDRIGRRPVYSAGFICLGTSLILYPYSKNVYPHMLLCRLLFSVGSAAATCMMTGSLSDVAGGQHERGRVSAIVGMFAGFGGLTAGLGLTTVPFKLVQYSGSQVKGIQLCFTIVGGVAIGFAVLCVFTMHNMESSHVKGVRYWTRRLLTRNKSTLEPRPDLPLIENPLKQLKYGFMAGRDPRVALAYMSSFVSRADTVLFSSYVSLWVVQYYEDLGWCGEYSCGAAAGDTHMLTGMAQGISLAFAPVYGYMCEKMEKSTVLAIAGVIGAVGSFPFAFTTAAPGAKSNYAWVNLVGVGQIGMIVTGMTLVNGLQLDARYRGSVAGVFSFCGALSIMVMAKLGGYLFDVWMRGAPFVLMGIAHSVIAIFSIYVRIITPRLLREDAARFAAKAQAGEMQDVATEHKDELSSMGHKEELSL
ncbi:MAG: major facilitator superfamily domain-containing protein [Podila humilis]|nr:MAG: major facilitator superfamily domain-containing protein [Podila humilis]